MCIPILSLSCSIQCLPNIVKHRCQVCDRLVLNQKHLSLAREKIESGLLRRVGGLDLIHRVSEHVRQGHSRGHQTDSLTCFLPQPYIWLLALP